MTGGWELAGMQACALPQRVATGFTEVFSGMVGATYMPVLYVASQIVAGTNHMILCRQQLAVAGGAEHLCKVILHEPLPNDPQPWHILSIETLI